MTDDLPKITMHAKVKYKAFKFKGSASLLSKMLLEVLELLMMLLLTWLLPLAKLRLKSLQRKEGTFRAVTTKMGLGAELDQGCPSPAPEPGFYPTDRQPGLSLPEFVARSDTKPSGNTP